MYYEDYIKMKSKIITRTVLQLFITATISFSGSFIAYAEDLSAPDNMSQESPAAEDSEIATEISDTPDTVVTPPRHSSF